MTMC
jgi:hypothetical protein